MTSLLRALRGLLVLPCAVHQLRKELHAMNQAVQDQFAALVAEVAEVREIEQSAMKLIQGLRQQLADALANSTSDADVVAAIVQIKNSLDQSSNELAGAVAGAPAEEPAPVEETPTDPNGADATDPTA